MSCELENICNYLLSLNNKLKVGELHSLLYYCQVWYILLYNQNLFEEDFEYYTEINMVVIPEIFQKLFKGESFNYSKIELKDDIKNHILDVYEILQNDIDILRTRIIFDLLLRQPTKENLKKIYQRKINIEGYSWFLEKVPLK